VVGLEVPFHGVLMVQTAWYIDVAAATFPAVGMTSLEGDGTGCVLELEDIERLAGIFGCNCETFEKERICDTYKELAWHDLVVSAKKFGLHCKVRFEDTGVRNWCDQVGEAGYGFATKLGTAGIDYDAFTEEEPLKSNVKFAD
jgi:hypothetical protein